MTATTATTASSPSPTTSSAATPLDNAAYWLAIVSIYVLQGTLWFHSGKSKIFDDDGNAPQPIKEQFDGTFFESFPGIDGAWIILGLLQVVIFAVLVVSVVRGEFLPARRKPLLLVGLALSLLCFALLLFGDVWTNNFEGTASLYAYFGATAVIFLFVLLMPPYRRQSWLSGLIER